MLEAVVAYASAAAPAECCGMLLGRAEEIVEALPARNLSDDPNRFLIDPQDHFDARRLARQRSLDLVGFYHSHPHSPPQPSATDLAEWSYPEAVCLIVSLAAETPEAKLFRLEDARFVETSLVTDCQERRRIV